MIIGGGGNMFQLGNSGEGNDEGKGRGNMENMFVAYRVFRTAS